MKCQYPTMQKYFQYLYNAKAQMGLKYPSLRKSLNSNVRGVRKIASENGRAVTGVENGQEGILRDIIAQLLING